MTDYKEYPEYKASGVEWMGEIPADWTVQRLKNFSTLIKRPAVEGQENITAFRNGLVTLRKNVRSTGYTEADKEHGYQSIHKGDLVIHNMDAFAGAIGVSDSYGKSTPVYSACIVNNNAVPMYLAYALRVMAWKGWILSLSKGIRERSTDFRWPVASNQKIPAPPLETQQAIVEFLGRETAHIDAGIANMESLIALLTEKRSALISEVVTRGIPGEHTEFKDSGVEWLGEIPVDRDKISFGQLFKRIKNMGTGDEELLSVYREYGVIPKSSRTDNHNVASEDLSKYQIVSKNNLVINKMKAWQGSLAISDHDGIVSPAYFVFEEKGKYKNNLKFLHYLMRSNSYKGFYASISKGIRLGQWDLDQKSHKSMPIFLPPVEEQDRIVAFIDSELPKIDAIVNEAKSAIALLKEKRQTLISDVVTGKIDVRNSVN